MMQKIHILRPDLREIIDSFDLQGLCLMELSMFKIASRSGNLPDVNLRIKVCSKWITMISGIGIQNVKRMDFIKIML
jgi:hypothetical protein